jgi:hypothetical protein
VKLPLFRVVWIALATVALASASRAEPIPFLGTIELHISTLDTVGIFGGGVADAERGGASGFHLAALGVPASAISAAGVQVPVTDPGAFPIAGLVFTVRNDPGGFAVGSDGRLGGAMPLRGVSKVCLFGTCSEAVANIAIPLSVVGAAGSVYVEGAVNVTVGGAPWTTGAVSPTSANPVLGLAHGPASATSTTARRNGTLSLVTPIFISTNIAAIPVVPAYGRLLQRFTTDPAQPRCEVAAGAALYGPGETVQFTTLRFANDGDLALPARLRLQLDVPGVGTASLSDVPATLPPHFDHDVGPVNAFAVTAQPAGRYVLRCTIEESNGIVLASHEAVFEIAPAP